MTKEEHLTSLLKRSLQLNEDLFETISKVPYEKAIEIKNIKDELKTMDAVLHEGKVNESGPETAPLQKEKEKKDEPEQPVKPKVRF